MGPRTRHHNPAAGGKNGGRKSRAFDVVFEDDDLIVVDKAAGVLTVPTPRRERFTLVDELSRYLSRGPRITKPAWVVHRLDRETTGLLVFAKNPRMRDALVAALADAKAERRYAAIVAGIVGGADDVDGEIRSHLATDKNLNRYSDAAGELAITRYRVVQRVGTVARGATLVDVSLVTGKRNQIRVHFAEAGHPLLGDDRYRGTGRHPLWDDKVLALHARRLGFVHPRTGAPLVFEVAPPRTFAAFLARAAPPSTSPPSPPSSSPRNRSTETKNRKRDNAVRPRRAP